MNRNNHKTYESGAHREDCIYRFGPQPDLEKIALEVSSPLSETAGKMTLSQTNITYIYESDDNLGVLFFHSLKKVLYYCGHRVDPDHVSEELKARLHVMERFVQESKASEKLKKEFADYLKKMQI